MKYLAYGSNMHPMRLKLRIPSAKFYKVISLKKYKLKFHKLGKDGSGKCNIFFTGNKKDKIYGIIYDIKDLEIKYLDRFEIGYEKKFLYLEEIKEEIFFYSALKKFINESLRPYDWYKNFVLEGAKYFNLPKEYIRMIERVDSVKDFDFDRTQQMQEILEQIKKADHLS